jgi:hypothetical protein
MELERRYVPLESPGGLLPKHWRQFSDSLQALLQEREPTNLTRAELAAVTTSIVKVTRTYVATSAFYKQYPVTALGDFLDGLAEAVYRCRDLRKALKRVTNYKMAAKGKDPPWRVLS